MSNMYGYTDYNGPRITNTEPPNAGVLSKEEDGGNLVVEDDHPLQAGFWMDGDSLAPPCGSSIPTIHQMLQFANLFGPTEPVSTHIQHHDKNEVLYDLGCGDGRVCLEACSNNGTTLKAAIGVEIENDLVDRGQGLAQDYYKRQLQLSNESNFVVPKIVQGDLCDILDRLIEKAKGKVEATKAPLDFPLPTVITLFLLPESLALIEPRCRQLLQLLPTNLEEAGLVSGKPPFRIVCNSWKFPTLRPVKEMEIVEGCVSTTFVYLYTRKSVSSVGG
jgi:hypothetical protein